MLDPLFSGAQRFSGRVCVITGAGQGIGRAAARRLGAEGAKIVIGERSADSAKATQDILGSFGVDAHIVTVDLTELSGAHFLMKSAAEIHGRIDVLVNNVGGTIWWQPYADYSEDQIEQELRRSLYTTLWCCRAVLPYMLDQKKGVIVNVSSVAGAKGALYRAPYAACKGGVDALTRTLAVENGRFGIRVNAVAPGVTTISDRSTSRLLLENGDYAIAASETEAKVRETRERSLSSLGRAGSVEEQAAAIAFLASDDAGFINGQIVECAGGSF